MQLSCPGCGNASQVPDHLLPPRGSRGRCGGCQRAYLFDGTALVDEDQTPPNPTRREDQVFEPIAFARPPIQLEPDRPPPPDEWRVKAGSAEAVVVTLTDLKGMIRSGSLADVDPVAAPGSDDWTPAAQNPQLKRYFAIKQTVKPAGDADPFATCRRHPASPSVWFCNGCGTAWCDACAVSKHVGALANVRVCSSCESALSQMKKQRAPVTPFYKDWGEVFSYPVRQFAWIALIVCAAMEVFAMISIILVATVILYATLFAYLLMITREGARGKSGLPDLGDVGNIISDMVWPGIKGIVVFVLVAGMPLTAYNALVVTNIGLFKESETSTFAGIDIDDPEMNLTEEEKQALRENATAQEQMGEDFATMVESMPAVEATGEDEEEDETAAEEDVVDEDEPMAGIFGFLSRVKPIHLVMWTLIYLWTAFLLPVQLMIVALHDTIRPALMPPLLLRIIKEVWPEYLYLAATVGVFVFLGQMVGGALAPLGIFVGTFLASIAHYYFYFMAFHAMGRFAHQIEDRLDWY